MNTPSAASTSLKASTYARPPFSRRTRSLQEVQGCTSSRDPKAGTDWWACEPATSDSLEYFAPAFHRVLDGADRAERDAGETARAEAHDDSSLEYFTPAFRRALGTTQGPGEEDVDERGDGTEHRERRDASTPSLEYFEPAFRRVLGQGRGRAAEGVGDEDGREEGREIGNAVGTVVEAVSEQGRTRLSALRRPRHRNGGDVMRGA